jgi:Na+/glutamate symporter
MVVVLGIILLAGLPVADWNHWLLETLFDCISGIAAQFFVVFALVVYLKIMANRATAG